MKGSIKKIVITDYQNKRVIFKKEFYSFSLLSRFQRFNLIFKTHTHWRLLYLYDTIIKKR